VLAKVNFGVEGMVGYLPGGKICLFAPAITSTGKGSGRPSRVQDTMVT
jgi:hypothetical protein